MTCASKIDLHSGFPYWPLKSGIRADFPKLTRDLSDEECVVIGSGISGALAAHELCSAGIRVTMLDRRLVSSGSTWASTAQLNYEIDVNIAQLAKTYGEEAAAAIYRANMSAVKRVGEILQECGVDAGYQTKPSLYLASDRSGAKEIEEEGPLRQKHGIPAEILDRERLNQDYGIDRRLALLHPAAAQLDAYAATAGIIQHHADAGRLKVFTRTAVTRLRPTKTGVELRTDTGHRITARRVVCAPGYESAQFLPKKVVKLHSTYALVTEPILPYDRLWKDGALIWETARPYFYMRSTQDGRAMIGGADEPFKNEARRDALLDKKEATLMKKGWELFPRYKDIQVDFSWCGTFGETDDGLPYIGEYPGMKGVFFALGYGGNGTTFSAIAAGILRAWAEGKKDERARLFAFDRKKK